MRKGGQGGFAAIELIIIVVVVMAVAGLGFLFIKNKQGGHQMTAAEIAADEAKRTGNSQSGAEKLPVLQNLLGIQFGPYSKSSQTSGDFVFSQSAADQSAQDTNMIFFPFAQKTCSNGTCKVQTEMAMQGLKLGTVVKAAAGGKVVGMQNEGTDYSFSTVSDDYPGYSVGYDHVAKPTIKEGDTIKAGDTIGTAAPYGDGKFARVELFIKKGTGSSTGSTVKFCPIDALDPKVKESITAPMKQFFSDWNGFIGKDVHKVSEMSSTGCIAKQTTE